MTLTTLSTNHHYSNGIGNRLRDLRRQRGLRQEEVAIRCGMSPAVLSRKETGKQPLTHTDIARLIAVFKLSPGEAFDLWCAAGMVATASLAGCSDGGVPALIERLGRMDVPALLFHRNGNLRAWNGYAEVIFQPSQVRRTTLHIFDVLAEWAAPDIDPQMCHESVSSLLNLLTPLITSEHTAASISIILQRLPNTPVGTLIRECRPVLARLQRHTTLHRHIRPIVHIPTVVGVIPFLVTYCPQEYRHNLVLMTLIPKDTDGTLNCDKLRALHQHVIQTVYVRE